MIKRLNNAVGRSRPDGFIFDSCNSMPLLREMILKNGDVKWAYWWATHALQNFSMEIGNMCNIKNFLSQVLFVSKSAKNNYIIHKLFDTICLKIYKKKY